jgi:hypothetical protein
MHLQLMSKSGPLRISAVPFINCDFPRSGEDNYFAPDLPDSVARPYWQRIDKPLLVLQSGSDEFMPSTIDKKALIEGWKAMCRPGIASDLSDCIPGANHRVEQPEAEAWLKETVSKFIQSI